MLKGNLEQRWRQCKFLGETVSVPSQLSQEIAFSYQEFSKHIICKNRFASTGHSFLFRGLNRKMMGGPTANGVLCAPEQKLEKKQLSVCSQ